MRYMQNSKTEKEFLLLDTGRGTEISQNFCSLFPFGVLKTFVLGSQEICFFPAATKLAKSPVIDTWNPPVFADCRQLS